MVMEATPSPQCVGREFVRQYYTLLNQAPTHLHRFYNNQSSFVHGGLGTPDREIIPAVGQKQIHQKIQQLNFRDCHAKISQVDSQATLGEGVVVQVTGELSNAGQPMRRFTQTFVLAAQAPKTYYVHNDIFRYQDLGFPDEEEGELEGADSGLVDSGDRERDDERSSEPEEDDQQQPQAQQQHSGAPSVADSSHPTIIANQQQPLQQQQALYYAPPPQQPVHPMMQPVINGSVHEETPLISQQQQQQQQGSQSQQQQHVYINEPTGQEQFSQEQEIEVSSEPQQQQQQQIDDETTNQTEELQEQTESENFTSTGRDNETEQTSAANANSNKPKTFANLFSSPFSNSMPPTSSQPPKMSISPPPMTNLRVSDDRSIVHPASSGPALSSSSNISPGQQQIHRVRSNQPSQQQQQQQQRPPRGGPAPRDGDRRGSRPGTYSDEHQLFLGNLPHQATIDELRAIFGRYGKVVDLRVNNKTNGGKGPQGQSSATRVPNYGFITFEDIQTVTKVLQAGPICYPDENGQKLNIEEKKARPRMSMEGGGSRPSLNDGNMRPVGGQQQQQQQQQQRSSAYSSGYSGGPGGAMRGGQHGTRGGRGGFSRGGDGGRGGGGGGGGGMRQPGNPNYQNRSR